MDKERTEMVREDLRALVAERAHAGMVAIEPSLDKPGLVDVLTTYVTGLVDTTQDAHRSHLWDRTTLVLAGLEVALLEKRWDVVADVHDRLVELATCDEASERQLGHQTEPMREVAKIASALRELRPERRRVRELVARRVDLFAQLVVFNERCREIGRDVFGPRDEKGNARAFGHARWGAGVGVGLENHPEPDVHDELGKQIDEVWTQWNQVGSDALAAEHALHVRLHAMIDELLGVK